MAELRGAREIAQKRVERLKGLEGTVPRKEIEAAQTEFASLRARESAIGGGLAAKENVVAPVSGVIASANVVLGQVVESKDVLFEITDPAKVMVEATTADPALAANISAATIKATPGVRLELIGAGRSLRDGVLPLTFKAVASDGTQQLPIAIGQPVTVIANSSKVSKALFFPHRRLLATLPMSLSSGSSQVQSAISLSPCSTKRWMRTGSSLPRGLAMKTGSWFKVRR